FAAANAFSGGGILFSDTVSLVVDEATALSTFADTKGITATGTGTVRLATTGSVTQTAGDLIAAGTLGVRNNSAVAGSISLDLANVVANFAAANAFSGGNILFSDT